MRIWKGLAIGLLSFLLLVSLSIFATLFLLNQTILNPSFITSQLDKVDVPALAEEILSGQIPDEDLPEEIEAALIDTITKLESPVKTQINAAIHSVFDYLLGGKKSPELALTLRNTFLSSDFVVSLMDELDLPSLVEQMISQQASEGDFPEEFEAALINTVTELEPEIKEELSAAVDPIFDYLLGQSQSIDLALILRNTFLSSEFAASLINELDISSLASGFINEQLPENIPEEMEFLTEYLDDAIIEIEPLIKEELVDAADPILDYLLGETQSLSISIALEPIIEHLEDSLKESFIESPPAEFGELSPAEIEQVADIFFAALTEVAPSTFEIDETMFGAEASVQIAEALTEGEEGLEQAKEEIAVIVVKAEEGLGQAREYISYFQLGFYIIIGLIVLLIAGIVLLNLNVKSATRKLGIIFMTWGTPWFASVLIGKYFLGKQIALLDIPPYFQELLPRIASDFLAPLQWLSLGILIGGIVLVVVSFVYNPGQQQDEP